jgi:hypothetical protein
MLCYHLYAVYSQCKALPAQQCLIGAIKAAFLLLSSCETESTSEQSKLHGP